MRNLREDERDEIEAVSNYVKYAISGKNVHPAEILIAFAKVKDMGDKYVMTDIVTSEELEEILSRDEIKELLVKFIKIVKENTENI